VTRTPLPDDRLDLRGVKCPANSARALVRLEGLDAGAVLEIVLDDGEPVETVPAALADEGHVVIDRRRDGATWTLLVRAGG
jgi:TusA-related sulfurtransferase